jgi:hypothetical protein
MASAMGARETLRRSLDDNVVVRRNRFARDLRRLHDALSKTSFRDRYWLWGGLLLGWAREGRPLQHDLFDADFAFFAEDGRHFAAGAQALVEAGFEPHLQFRNNAGQATEYVFRRNQARFEFFALERRDEMLRYHVFTSGCEHEARPVQAVGEIRDQPTDEFRFLRRSWRKHLDHEAELSEVYGDWRNTDPDWWFMSSPSIVHREPWRYTDHPWHGPLPPEPES